LTKLLTDLEKLGVKPFSSIWEKVNPLKHEVMTVVPWKEADVVFDEFEKGYLLWDKVLRPAKVIVGGE
jgi:molecular chaperone GrpE